MKEHEGLLSKGAFWLVFACASAAILSPAIALTADRTIDRTGDRHWDRDAIYAARETELRQAIATRPDDADVLVDLASFYLKPLASREVEGADGRKRVVVVPLRNEVTGPIKETYCVPWVFRGEPDRARPMLDRALKLNPQHSGAIRQMAMLLRMKSNLDAMRPYMEAAMKGDPGDLDMARLYLDHRTAQALVLNDQASSLRTPRSWEEDRADGKYVVTQNPSDADLARANQLDEQSQAIRRDAIAPLERLAGALKDDPALKTDPAKRAKWRLATAIYCHWVGDLENAAGTAMAALREDPTDLDSLDFVIDLLRGTHTNDDLKKYKAILDRWGGVDSQPVIVRDKPRTRKL